MCQIVTLRAISDVVTTGLYAVDHRTDEIVYFNDAFLEMWGVGHIKGQMRRGELKNSDMVSIMLQLSHDPGTLSKYYEQFREANNISHVSDVIWLRDGRIFHFNSSRVVDEDGLYHSRVYAFDDITSVIEAERSAHERGDQFRELVDMLPQVIFEIDTEGKLTFANRNAFAVMGYTEDELAEGLCVSDVIALEDYPEASKQILNVLSGGRSGHEYTFVRKDRSRFKAIVHSSIIYRDGRPSGLRGIAVDLTERKQEEEKLLLMQASIDSFHDPCIWAEENGRIIYLNDAACHTLGYSMDELLHMRISDFDVSYDNDRFMEKGQEIRASGGAHFETLHRTKDGRVFPVEISAKYIRYGDKRYVLSFEHDITDRKRAEDQLKNSLVEKEVLLKEVHHRVKNNMQIISSLLNLQLSGIDQEPVRQILTES
ncbi:MAG TPA: PAS domain S-box protein, partial [Methanocella sp.]|nr:PAS domain S-box protein [Methanocella sp.]